MQYFVRCSEKIVAAVFVQSAIKELGEQPRFWKKQPAHI